MMSLELKQGVWHADYDGIQPMVSALGDVLVLPLKDFDASVGVSEEEVRAVQDALFLGIRDAPITPDAVPPPCTDTKLVTGVRVDTNAYLLNISPAGRHILVQGLTTALREIEDWEFNTRVCYPPSVVASLRDTLAAATD